MIRRRHLRILLLAVFFCSGSALSNAASSTIGVLSAGTPESTAPVLAGLRQGLRDHGYVEGVNITLEPRFAHGRFDRLADLAQGLIAMRVDVLITVVTQASIAARDNTQSIPIVIVGVSDPVASGLVTSLARPGGNVTGTAAMNAETAGEWLELLRELVPGDPRIAVLWNPTNRIFQLQLIRQTEAAARLVGVQLQLFEARDLDSIDKAFESISKGRFSGLNVLADPTFIAHAGRIATLAEKARLPSVSGNSVYAEAGGLMAYGPSYPELARVAGGYVAKILKGASPADLPVQQPTKFELVINAKTARQLGVSIPASILLRADRVID
jgi:putative ABC transport system substrate-binding protein